MLLVRYCKIQRKLMLSSLDEQYATICFNYI